MAKSQKEFGDALRAELVEMVQDYMTPVALRYGYSQVGLDNTIRWRPLILVLGNYSSGKSTLINEYVGSKVQATGQAPTDDSFTVITGTGPTGAEDEREGAVLLNDPAFPFEVLKRHGQRFAAHFRLKQVSSPNLQDLAIVDTPGMLDSVAERDRGYNYQEVIADLAQIADLIVVMFDPHKAGTIRESYQSLRQTLPDNTFEDRLVFVLNRVDECESLNDLLRVYGTLCWNLSQMIGRKDIPRILLTYTHQEGGRSGRADFLQALTNDRSRLLELIAEAPRHRLDHLASYIEHHGERLCHFLEALVQFQKRSRRFWLRHLLHSVTAGVVALALGVGVVLSGLLVTPGQETVGFALAGLVSILVVVFWMGPLWQRRKSDFKQAQIRDVDQLTELGSQSRLDSWEKIKPAVQRYLERNHQNLPMNQIKQDLKETRTAYKRSAKVAREALRDMPKSIFVAAR